MEIESVRAICFSPTGTTNAVVRAIARSSDCGSVDLLDITRPAAREKRIRTGKNDLLIAGVPVYLRRVPALARDWLKTIVADETPAVCVALYGNRAYDDALVELADILAGCGCRPVAGAAFIGEHSFSTTATPTARGRPDARDLALATAFGEKVREKIRSCAGSSGIPAVPFPGTRPYRQETCHPYRKGTVFWNVDFIAVSEACTGCGTCAAGCPVGAIDPESRAIDTERCITCCACIRNCPAGARSLKPGIVMDASMRLHTVFRDRKEPEFFI